mmetsp:Transcript_81973/g.180144  ORF Transcript_81973/g.180144 Transcript_81973/m.180144 type:complete len:87 (-) Transcript_81973:324-584(-)
MLLPKVCLLYGLALIHCLTPHVPLDCAWTLNEAEKSNSRKSVRGEGLATPLCKGLNLRSRLDSRSHVIVSPKNAVPLGAAISSPSS